jgi:hypothetical protein
VVNDAVLEGEGAESVQLGAAQVHVGVASRAEVKAGAGATLLLGEEREVE